MKRIYLILIYVTLALSIIACKKKDNNDNNQEDLPNVEPSQTITSTQAPTQTPSPTPTVTDPEAGEELEDSISKEEAEKLILNQLEDQGYFIQFINDITIEEDYYVYSISSSGEAIEPNILVNKRTGELAILKEDKTIASIAEHPLLIEKEDNSGDKNDAKGEDGNEDVFTKEDALNQLLQVPHDKLNLPVGLEEYTIVYDDWTTVIQGKECYGINAFVKTEDRMINMGVFFVATDGSSMYQFDVEADDFVEIK